MAEGKNSITGQSLNILRILLNSTTKPNAQPPAEAKRLLLEDVPIDNLRREKIVLEQEEKKILHRLHNLDMRKLQLFRDGVTKASSDIDLLIIAREIKELDVEAANLDGLLQIFSKQMRLINGLLQVKERSLVPSSNNSIILSKLSLDDVLRYINLSSAEGEFQMTKFDDLLRTMGMNASLAPEYREDSDVMDIVYAMMRVREVGNNSTQNIDEEQNITEKKIGLGSETRNFMHSTDYADMELALETLRKMRELRNEHMQSTYDLGHHEEERTHNREDIREQMALPQNFDLDTEQDRSLIVKNQHVSNPIDVAGPSKGIDQKANVCPDCGRVVLAHARFCHFCGHAFKGVDTSYPANGNETKNQVFAVARIVDANKETSVLLLGKEYVLEAGLSNDEQFNSSMSYKASTINLDSLQGQLSTIVIIIRSENITTDIQSKEIKISSTDLNEPKILKFSVHAIKIGNAKIFVDFYYERHWLQTITLDVKVLEK